MFTFNRFFSIYLKEFILIYFPFWSFFLIKKGRKKDQKGRKKDQKGK
jgi:hypothetical protein